MDNIFPSEIQNIIYRYKWKAEMDGVNRQFLHTFRIADNGLVMNQFESYAFNYRLQTNQIKEYPSMSQSDKIKYEIYNIYQSDTYDPVGIVSPLKQNKISNYSIIQKNAQINWRHMYLKRFPYYH